MENVEKLSNSGPPGPDKKTYSELENENTKLKLEMEELSAKLTWYEEQFRLAAHKKYGPSSEKTDDGEPLSAFNEAEKEARATLDEPELEEITYKRSRARKPTGERFAGLPVETVEYTLSESELVCEDCGETLTNMSKQARRELVVIPA